MSGGGGARNCGDSTNCPSHVRVSGTSSRLAEAGADAVVFALEEIELNRVGVVGPNENEVFGKAH